MWWDVWSLWHDTWRPVPERRMKGEQLQQERAMSPVAIRLLFFRFLLLSSTIYSGCVSTRCKWANQAETGIRLSRSDFWRDRILIRSATGLSNQMNSRYEMKRPVHNNRFSIFSTRTPTDFPNTNSSPNGISMMNSFRSGGGPAAKNKDQKWKRNGFCLLDLRWLYTTDETSWPIQTQPQTK